MIGRRAVVGLALLSALVFAAFAAPSASAEKGTTVFTCVKGTPGEEEFVDAHCKTKDPNNEGEYEHKEIAQDKTTVFHGTNDKTTDDTKGAVSAILKSKVFGAAVEITCEKVFSHGSITNKKEGSEHYIHAEKITILYTGCKYNKPSTCKVVGGEIEVTGVTATSKGEGQNIRFKPEAGETFVTIKSEGGICPAEAKVTGSVRGQVEGATLVFDEEKTTADESLKFAGNGAGLSGKITLSQADETLGKTGNPLSATTIK